jgi:hypothetical protein
LHSFHELGIRFTSTAGGFREMNPRAGAASIIGSARLMMTRRDCVPWAGAVSWPNGVFSEG